MTETPSRWIREVRLRKRYARILGHRMSVRVDSASRVRLLGESRLAITTSYDSIAGRSLASEAALAAMSLLLPPPSEWREP